MRSNVNKKNNIKTIIRILKYMFKYKMRMVLIFIGFLGATFITVATSYFFKVVIDDYITPMIAMGDNADFSKLTNEIIKFSFVVIFGIICSVGYRLLALKIITGVSKSIREDMYRKMQDFTLRYFDTQNAGDIMSRYTNDLDTLRGFMQEALPEIISSTLSFIFTLSCMMMLSINLMIVVLVMIALMIMLSKFIGSRSLGNYRTTQKSVGGINGYVEEMVLGAKEVKVYNFEVKNVANFDVKNLEWITAAKKADKLAHIIMPLMNGIGCYMYVFIALIGGVMMVHKVPNVSLSSEQFLTIGIISSFLTFTRSISSRIGQLSSMIPVLMQSISGAERVFELLDTESEIDDGKVKLIKDKDGVNHWLKPDAETVKFVGDIVLENVNFSYEENKQILTDINIYANKGQTVALVGATGAGKTTITNLINRYYEITSGKITFDGIDVKDINKYDLRNSMSLVLQDVHLFSGTIIDNIRYGRLDATDEECIKAAELACASVFIEELPDGYNTIIKGDSGELSQGQKQLISIARVAVSDPACLILDEATSSIDTRTEKLVQKGMNKIMQGRTVFIIAHRLSTIRDADVIMVMQHGKIIERGNHEELLEKKGAYYELYTGKVNMEA